jgi:prolipoprotein diacylglyceryltransferase
MGNKPNPYLLGFSIGICFGLALLVSALWFPWIGDAKYKHLRDVLFFSVFLFVILTGRYWSVRRVPKLWLAFLILAGAHSVGC